MLVVRIRIRICIRIRIRIRICIRILIRIRIRYVECSAVQCSAVLPVTGQLQVWGEARCFLFFVCGVLGVVDLGVVLVRC